MIILIAGAVAKGGAALNLNGEIISNTEADPTQARAWVIFNPDGTVDKREGGSVTQIDSGTDWIIPNIAASSIYEVRFTGLTGDAFNVLSAAADNWVDIGTGRAWGYTNTTNGTTASGDATFEIRRGSSGAAIVGATYDLTAIRTA